MQGTQRILEADGFLTMWSAEVLAHKGKGFITGLKLLIVCIRPCINDKFMQLIAFSIACPIGFRVHKQIESPPKD